MQQLSVHNNSTSMHSTSAMPKPQNGKIDWFVHVPGDILGHSFKVGKVSVMLPQAGLLQHLSVHSKSTSTNATSTMPKPQNGKIDWFVHVPGVSLGHSFKVGKVSVMSSQAGLLTTTIRAQQVNKHKRHFYNAKASERQNRLVRSRPRS